MESEICNATIIETNLQRLAPTRMGNPAVAHLPELACVNATAAGSCFGRVTLTNHKLSICSILHAPKARNRSRSSVRIGQALGPM